MTVEEVKNDVRYSKIKIVLKSANRAVAHLEANDINHPIKLDEDNNMLFDAISFTKEMIVEKIYLGDKKEFERIMKMPENDMNNSK